MYSNYLKTAIRNLVGPKIYSLINIFGLALGLSIFFLITMYVTFEKSYDKFYQNTDRIFRLRNDRIYSDKHDKSAGCPPALAVALKKEFPEVVESARIKNTVAHFTDNTNNKLADIDKAYFADPSFLKIFTLNFNKKVSEDVLNNPFTIIISNSFAQKYFKNKNPLQKTVSLQTDFGKQDYTIKGIFNDIPENSHLKFQILISYSSLVSLNSDAEYYWGWNAFNTYVLLNEDMDPKLLEAKLPHLIEKYKNYEEGYQRRYLLQPLAGIHLNSNLRFEPEVNGNATTVNVLFFIAVFILLLSWINYINLSTSRAIKRSREVGIRKVLGSTRVQLMKQFLLESAILNLVALLLALLITSAALTYFNELTGKSLELGLIINNWTSLTLILLSGTILSGLYPAFVMSSYSPQKVLKMNYFRINTKSNLRKGLVTFQFVISIALIASSVVVYNQMKYLKNKDLGINLTETMVIKPPVTEGSSYTSITTFKDLLATLPDVKTVSLSSAIPGKEYSNSSSGVRKFDSKPSDGKQGYYIDVDESYFNLLEVPLSAGRFFTRGSKFNNEIIINEKAVDVYGFRSAKEAIGKKLVFDGFNGQSISVVGVVKNYNHLSLRNEIQPIIFNPVNDKYNNRINYISIKISSTKIQNTIAKIKQIWNEKFEGQDFQYNFIDEIFNTQYKADMHFEKVLGLFTLFAILISFMGLFGLTSFLNLQRTKELGIRKVIGASSHNLIFLLIKDYLKLALYANLIAWPLTTFFMNKWLTNFAYRIEVSIWILLTSGSLALMVTVLTVGTQAYRAANVNPIKSLKYE